MAGVLPYTNINPFTGQLSGDVWVMISQERGGPDPHTWDSFSGKVDPGETIKEAAAREGAEESCEMFGTADKIAAKMFPMGHSKTTFLLNAEDLRNKDEIINKCSAEAFLARKKWAKYQSGKYQEKTAVKWVKLSKLVDACANKNGILKKNGHKDMQVRPHFAKNIVKHQEFLQKNLIDPQAKFVKAAQAQPVKKVKNNPVNQLVVKTNNITLKVVEAKDLCTFPAEAIVNAANKKLAPGHGVCGAIYKQGGSAIFDECHNYLAAHHIKTLPAASAIVTTAGKLDGKKYVIHAVCPKWTKEANKQERKHLYVALHNAYSNSLTYAHKLGLKSIAFPSLSTGIYNFPLKKASKIAAQAFKEFASSHPKSSLKKVSFVLWPETFNEYKASFQKAYAGNI